MESITSVSYIYSTKSSSENFPDLSKFGDPKKVVQQIFTNPSTREEYVLETYVFQNIHPSKDMFEEDFNEKCSPLGLTKVFECDNKKQEGEENENIIFKSTTCQHSAAQFVSPLLDFRPQANEFLPPSSNDPHKELETEASEELPELTKILNISPNTNSLSPPDISEEDHGSVSDLLHKVSLKIGNNASKESMSLASDAQSINIEEVAKTSVGAASNATESISVITVEEAEFASRFSELQNDSYCGALEENCTTNIPSTSDAKAESVGERAKAIDEVPILKFKNFFRSSDDDTIGISKSFDVDGNVLKKTKLSLKNSFEKSPIKNKDLPAHNAKTDQTSKCRKSFSPEKKDKPKKTTASVANLPERTNKTRSSDSNSTHSQDKISGNKHSKSKQRVHSSIRKIGEKSGLKKNKTSALSEKRKVSSSTPAVAQTSKKSSSISSQSSCKQQSLTTKVKLSSGRKNNRQKKSKCSSDGKSKLSSSQNQDIADVPKSTKTGNNDDSKVQKRLKLKKALHQNESTKITSLSKDKKTYMKKSNITGLKQLKKGPGESERMKVMSLSKDKKTSTHKSNEHNTALKLKKFPDEKESMKITNLSKDKKTDAQKSNITDQSTTLKLKKVPDENEGMKIRSLSKDKNKDVQKSNTTEPNIKATKQLKREHVADPSNLCEPDAKRTPTNTSEKEEFPDPQSVSITELRTRIKSARNALFGKSDAIKKKFIHEDLDMFVNASYVNGVCRLCGESNTKKQKWLKKHLVSGHFQFELFQCQICKEDLLSKESLRHHLKMHHSKTHIKEDEKSGLHCPECGLAIPDAKQYREHFEMVHKAHKCSECSKRFSKSELLKKHMQSSHKPVKGTKIAPKICKIINYNKI